MAFNIIGKGENNKVTIIDRQSRHGRQDQRTDDQPKSNKGPFRMGDNLKLFQKKYRALCQVSTPNESYPDAHLLEDLQINIDNLNVA